MTNDDGNMSFLGILATCVAVVLGFWILGFGVTWLSSLNSPTGAQIGVVREGSSFFWAPSWLNGNKIRSVVVPNSGNTFTGMGSSVHWYPNSSVARTYTISSDPAQGDRPGVDVDQVATSDGVTVALNGTFYFTTAFDGSSAGQALTEDFDQRFGVRTFRVNGSDDELHPWEGTDGWDAFLDNIIRPIIDSDLRQSISQVSCAQLVSSCALVYSQNVSAVQSQHNATELTTIQNTINQTMRKDIAQYLGKDYFSNIKFVITGKPGLPPTIQTEINRAQAQFAAVGTAKAQVDQATQLALANKQKQKGYLACPACAEAAILAAIPSNVTTFAPGSNFAITPPQTGK